MADKPKKKVSSRAVARTEVGSDAKPYAEATGAVEVPVSLITQTIRRLIGYGLLEEFERRCDDTMTVTASPKAVNLAKEFLEKTGSRAHDTFVEMTLGPASDKCPPGYRCPRAK
jgi:hypothetical protein